MTAISILPEGHYYRGNLHGHSTCSDGRDSPEEVIRLYRQAGYDFTCLSEHYWSDTRFCAQSVVNMQSHNSEEFITILSAELHCHGKKHDRDGLWHILANGLPADFPMASDDETGPQLVRRAVDAGAYVSIPHPEWYTLGDDEALSLAAAGAHGVEIYITHPRSRLHAVAARPPSTCCITRVTAFMFWQQMIRIILPRMAAGDG